METINNKTLIDKEKLYTAIENYKNVKVLVIGDIILDEYIWGRSTRLSPEAPVPILEAQKTSYILGGASNVVNNLSSLGGNVCIIGVVGDDLYAEKVKELLKNSNIEYDCLITDNDRPTTVKTRMIAHNHQQLGRVDREKKSPIDFKTESSIKEALDKKIDNVDAVILSDYAKGVLTSDLTKYIIKVSKDKGKIILADPKGIDYEKYRGVDLITPNRAEAEASTRLSDNTDAITLAKEVCKLVNSRHGFVTLGEDGVLLIDEEEVTHITAVTSDVYDVTGAGDTLISTVALSLAATKGDYKTSVMLGNYAAGVVVRKVGTSTISQEELKDIIELDLKKKVLV